MPTEFIDKVLLFCTSIEFVSHPNGKVFQNVVLRGIHESMREEVTGVRMMPTQLTVCKEHCTPLADTVKSRDSA
jgi:hypothetical protein